MCFIGHGAFGIITKPVWCNYFAVIGTGRHMAYQLMPLIGIADILLGFSLLFYPLAAVAAWLVVWGIVTASLRPLSGEPLAEMAERAGNFGAPLVLLLLSVNNRRLKSLFQQIKIPLAINAQRFKNVQNCLRWAAFLLLAGHGVLNLGGKKALLLQYASLGFHNVQQVAVVVGLMEVAAAIIILFRPSRPLVLVLLIWKMASELFYPHWEVFEWVERAGSYGVLLALYFSLPRLNTVRKNIYASLSI